MYLYETHCHTSPVSSCGRAPVEDTVRFYQRMGYDGVFLTNHFLDGNINPDVWKLSFREQIDYYFRDYEEAAELGDRIGIRILPGVELSYLGTDFLIYGLEKDWYKDHPEILAMEKREELAFLMEEGAYVIQAHPYREAYYIDHIRLFPRSVHGIEIINSGQAWEANEMALLYAKQYHLTETCGSDNHWGSNVFTKLREKGYRPEIAGMSSDTKICSVQDYITQVKNRQMSMFLMDESGEITIYRPGSP